MQIACRHATSTDAADVGRLLHQFNTEFDTPTPGPTVLADRFVELLAAGSTLAVLAGSPPVGIALVTLRPNIWFAGPVALLDELYVEPDARGRGVGTAIIASLVDAAAQRRVGLLEINVDEGDVDAQRFYRRHGFTEVDPDSGERALYFFRELTDR